MTKAIRKTFQNSKYIISYKTRNNVFDIINKKTSQINNQRNKFDQSGIYKLNCSDCNSFYIGQTGRSFRSRFKEHIQALRSKNSTTIKSNFAEHLLNENHNYKGIEENLEIIEYLNKGGTMNSKEEFHIYSAYLENKDNLLNIQIPLKNPIFEKSRNIKLSKI